MPGSSRLFCPMLTGTRRIVAEDILPEDRILLNRSWTAGW